jgi:hypothetical protein
MKILFEVSTYGYKTYHSLAKQIKKLYPDSKFGIARGPVVALNFLKEQTDIEYEICEYDDSSFHKNDIDYDELRKFEDRLPYKSLWRIVASDRGLGRAFLHGAVGYESKFPNDHEYILCRFTGMLKSIRTMFVEFKPNIFIPAIAMGDIGVTIFEQMCEVFGVVYAVPDSVRVKNICAFASSPQIIFPQIEDLARKLMNGDVELDKTSAEETYDNLMNELEDPDYFDAKNNRLQRVEFSNSIHRIKYQLLSIPLSIVKIIIQWQIGYFKKLLKRENAINYKFTALFRLIEKQVLSAFQKLKLTDPQFGVVLDSSQKYIYFPLQGQPEYSSNILGTMWMDHLNLIEILAKSIPADWVVYIKEHPGVLADRIRPVNFYKKIERLPNVFLAPLYMSTHEIISNSEMVAVISGTSGWEAIWRNKPVIEFRSNQWSLLSLSKKCTDIDLLSIDIYNEIERIKEILPEERKRRIVCLLAAMLKYGFQVTYPKSLFYIEPGSDEEYEVSGEELANGLVKHLEYLQKEKGNRYGIHQEA